MPAPTPKITINAPPAAALARAPVAGNPVILPPAASAVASAPAPTIIVFPAFTYDWEAGMGAWVAEGDAAKTLISTDYASEGTHSLKSGIGPSSYPKTGWRARDLPGADAYNRWYYCSLACYIPAGAQAGFWDGGNEFGCDFGGISYRADPSLGPYPDAVSAWTASVYADTATTLSISTPSIIQAWPVGEEEWHAVEVAYRLNSSDGGLTGTYQLNAWVDGVEGGEYTNPPGAITTLLPGNGLFIGAGYLGGDPGNSDWPTQSIYVDRVAWNPDTRIGPLV